VCSRSKKDRVGLSLHSSLLPVSAGLLGGGPEANRKASRQIQWQAFSSIFTALPPAPGIAVASDQDRSFPEARRRGREERHGQARRGDGVAVHSKGPGRLRAPIAFLTLQNKARACAQEYVLRTGYR
jgi:hypothetical protein